jgi:hypothetical protein
MKYLLLLLVLLCMGCGGEDSDKDRYDAIVAFAEGDTLRIPEVASVNHDGDDGAEGWIYVNRDSPYGRVGEFPNSAVRGVWLEWRKR